MLAYHFRRDEQGCVPLYRSAFNRVHAVRCPDTVAECEDPHIYTPSARTARLDLKARMAEFQCFNDRINSQGLVMDCRGSGMPGNSFGYKLVMVPLDIADPYFADQGIHSMENIRQSSRIGQVKHLLGPALDGTAPRRRGQYPVRMGAGHPGVGVDHFRLKP